ncbi:unnamed protein product [Anisakis simplex]|uniref:Uncharacterized protein n=1 Tax=Anisakis simplex TaxID=6269 RepID=A0A3P6QXX9_ANISI|nr:unnamed protein product [Anisakis simplex]
MEMNQVAVQQKLPQKMQEMLTTMECMGADQYSNGTATSTLGAGARGGSYINHMNTYAGRPREDRV